VIRGEAGDDILLGGDGLDGNTPPTAPTYDWIYGGEGDDAIFGEKLAG
jgi:Ca2+-binding RTX toxin-like protein